MGLFTTQQAPLSSSTKAAGATKSQIFAIQTEGKTSTLVSNVLSSHQDQLNQIASILRNPPPPLTALGVTDPNGMLIAWIGDREVNGVQYEGGYFANLYIGGTDPTNAVIVIDGQDAQITINDNGSIEILDPNNDVTAEIGTIYDATYGITSISAVTAPVVTLAATPAISFTTGDTVIHAGDTVPQYNGNFTITVLTPTTYTMNGVTNHGAGTGGTARRYFSGVAGERGAFGGDPFSPFSANFKTQADGSIVIIIPQGGVTTTIGNLPIGSLGSAGLKIEDNTSQEYSAISQNGLVNVDSSGNDLITLVNTSSSGANLDLVNISGNTSLGAGASPTEAFLELGQGTGPGTFGVAARVSSSAAFVSVFDPGGDTATLANSQLSLVATAGDHVDLNYVSGLTIGIGSNNAVLSATSLSFNGTQVLTVQQPAIAPVSGTAGATYTSVEQGIVNALVTAVNALLSALGIHGIIA